MYLFDFYLALSNRRDLPVAVPYANLTNPQTLNPYAMVADDPESFADLDGHQDDAIKKQKEYKGVSAGRRLL